MMNISHFKRDLHTQINPQLDRRPLFELHTHMKRKEDRR
jgi:hypothetical protein